MMQTVTIENMPDPLFNNLQNSAKAHHRSLNSEIIACLEYQQPKTKNKSPKQIAQQEEFLKQVRQRRKQAGLPALTDEFLAESKFEGR
ncbi:MAG: Arc family DNA-binding protein [Deltaproteobacteria bacterium]|nr:Arc family DNA-binding protein [Deltaproteobacteria bacterium]